MTKVAHPIKHAGRTIGHISGLEMILKAERDAWDKCPECGWDSKGGDTHITTGCSRATRPSIATKKPTGKRGAPTVMRYGTFVVMAPQSIAVGDTLILDITTQRFRKPKATETRGCFIKVPQSYKQGDATITVGAQAFVTGTRMMTP